MHAIVLFMMKQGKDLRIEEIPEELRPLAEEYRQNLIENVSDLTMR